MSDFDFEANIITAVDEMDSWQENHWVDKAGKAAYDAAKSYGTYEVIDKVVNTARDNAGAAYNAMANAALERERQVTEQGIPCGNDC